MSFPVSDTFKAAYTKSHRVIASGSIQDQASGDVILGPLVFDTTQTNEVQIDVTNANRRQMTVALLDRPAGSILPVDKTSPLAPISNEIVLLRGIRYVDGTSELAQLGVFGIFSAQEVRTGGAGPSVVVTGYDRSKRFDVDLAKPISFPAGTPFTVIVAGLLDATGVTVPQEYDPSVPATSSPKVLYHSGDNVWQAVQTIATALGCWAYFDVFGTFQMQVVPDTTNATPSWVYQAGPDCVFDQTDRTLETEDGSSKSYSHAFVISTVHKAGVAPVRADSTDNDPTSPTYIFGTFGDRPVTDSNIGSLVSTAAQAQKASDALLRRNYGLLERVQFSAAPNPALDGGDVLQITDPGSDTNAPYVLEALNVPLFAAGGEMTATFRTRQTR